nr:PREDICTED: uncharacterized protein LOC107079214 [Lepisosteus oculatus]
MQGCRLIRVWCFFWLALSSQLLAFVLSLDSHRQCSEDDQLLFEEHIEGQTKPVLENGCLMQCTLEVYSRMSKRKNLMISAVRLNLGSAGAAGEYCFPTKVRCTKGQYLQSVFVLLPVETGTQAVDGPVALRPSSSSSLDERDLVRLHQGQTGLVDNCGLRFNVTEAFTARQGGKAFCVEIVSEQGTPALKCEPFLATVWWRQRRPPD